MTDHRSPAVIETHSAVVVFIGDRAYKVKKPVDLGFLDFTTIAARREACHREVALNRRLAPDVYLGVADVTGPDGDVCEHMVVMRRVPEERRLSACIARGEDVDRALQRIAHAMATLHEQQPADPQWDSVGTTAKLRQRWDDGLAQMRRSALFDDAELARVGKLVGRYLDGREPLFERRIARGRIRDGHGDLQADDIFLLEDGPRILDCIDFADELRWVDVLDDVAFLAMDLERLGRADLATRFLAWHREYSADTWPASLAHHYVAYRAHVRAKVTALRAEQGDPSSATAARSLFELMSRHLDSSRVRLVLVGGLPGTGKSTIAAELASRISAMVLRTDEIRGGRRGDEHGFAEGRYSPANVRATYETMLHQAQDLLSLGETVILDASWSDAAMRGAVRDIARATISDIIELRCDVDAPLARGRIIARQSRGQDPSEATAEIATAMARRFTPWPEASVLLTSGSVQESIARAVGVIDAVTTTAQ